MSSANITSDAEIARTMQVEELTSVAVDATSKSAKSFPKLVHVEKLATLETRDDFDLDAPPNSVKSESGK